MADGGNPKRNGLFRRRRTGQILDRRAAAENDAAPEVPVAVHAPTAVSPGNLPVRPMDPDIPRAHVEILKMNAQRAGGG